MGMVPLRPCAGHIDWAAPSATTRACQGVWFAPASLKRFVHGCGHDTAFARVVVDVPGTGIRDLNLSTISGGGFNRSLHCDPPTGTLLSH